MKNVTPLTKKDDTKAVPESLEETETGGTSPYTLDREPVNRRNEFFGSLSTIVIVYCILPYHIKDVYCSILSHHDGHRKMKLSCSEHSV